MNPKNTWTVQWSESQQCFHVERFDKFLAENLRKFIEANKFNDWSLVGITDSYEKAHEWCSLLREKRGIPTIFETFAQEHPE